jgi:hypothetical protein
MLEDDVDELAHSCYYWMSKLIVSHTDNMWEDCCQLLVHLVRDCTLDLVIPDTLAVENQLDNMGGSIVFELEVFATSFSSKNNHL